MKTKTIITGIILGLLFFSSNAVIAQKGGNNEGRKEKKEKLDSLKKEFFNAELALTETEKSKFWPMYEAFEASERKLKNDFRDRYKKNDIIYMDEAKAKVYLTDLNKHKEQLLELEKEYQTKYLTILSAKKVVMIHRTEKEWHGKMRSFLKDKMRNR